MSVLDRLALKALGSPGAIRPRLSGLFERDAGADGIDAAASSAAATAIGGNPVVPLAGVIPSRTEAPAVAPGELRRSAVAPAPPGLAALPSIVPPAPHPEHGNHGQAESSATNRAASPSQSARRADSGTAAGNLPQNPAPANEASEAPAPPSATPRAPYQPLLPPLAPRGAALAPVVPRADPSGSAEPDIRISIGRIEVRGEPERRRPPAAPRAGPRLMSLEDYLAKGRRR